MGSGRLGELEELLLMALLRLGGVASGIDLRQELDEQADRRVLPGAVYTVMERMADRELVTSFTGDATPERGGRRRKYYRMTPEGERVLAESYRQLSSLAEGLVDRLTRLAKEP